MSSLIIVKHHSSLPSPATRIAQQNFGTVDHLNVSDSDLSDPLKFLRSVIDSDINESNNIFFDLFGVHLSTPIKVLVKLSHALSLSTPNLIDHPGFDDSILLTENSNTVIGHSRLTSTRLSIGRACCISDYVVISEGLRLGSFCYIGSHTIISSNVTIDDFTSIGSHIQIQSNTKLSRYSYITKPFTLIDSELDSNVSQAFVPDFSIYS